MGDELADLIAAVPIGWSRTVVGGRAYGLTRTDHADGRSISVHAEELGGSDVVSTHVWRTEHGMVLRPCEMPAEKVLDFLHAHARPIGRPVPGWSPRPRPSDAPLVGRTCSVEVLRDEHLPALHQALDLDSAASIWTYYPGGPYPDIAALRTWLDPLRADPDTQMRAILDPAGVPLGVAGYLRTDPANGVIEVGNIVLASSLQRTTAATEAMALMMTHVFDDLGYRRYEWKCDDLNAPSRRAALRLGFGYEGTFRNARIYRGRNRDTAWFSIIDTEWPVIRAELHRWLAPANHHADGRQRTPLQVSAAR